MKKRLKHTGETVTEGDQRFAFAIPSRLMVGHLTLIQAVEVRVLPREQDLV